MADELQTSMTLAFTKGNDTLNFSVSDKTDVSGRVVQGASQQCRCP